jgi:mono/diheme cytochrome c family protein
MHPSRLLIPSLLLVLLSHCSSPGPISQLPADHSFSQPAQILQKNCVHCHGSDRLDGMPAISTTKALARLIGPGNYIVPGSPDQSRFYQVIIFPDEIPNAMPPTGHAIPKQEANAIRQWILDGARLPVENLQLTPVGEAPRSR